MAAATAQLNATVTDATGEPFKQWTKDPLLGDVPTRDGLIRLDIAYTFLHTTIRGGTSLGNNVDGADPGVGGGGNATIQAQHNDRNTASRVALLSMIDKGSSLYRTVSVAPFLTGRHIWDYLQTPDLVYLRPSDDEAAEHIRKVQQFTYKDLPVSKQDKDLVLNFKAMIEGHNPLLHPNMNINNASMIAIFCNGLHPEAKVVALQTKQNNAMAIQNGCCFP